MRGLLAYSGITAKVHAMEGKLLTDEDYKNMAVLESVPEAVHFLQQFSPYETTFSSMDEDSLHRGIIERILTDSLYRDYTKLYRFANMKQRQFLDFYFLHFETDILKNCLRNAVAHSPVSLGLARYEKFFARHSTVDLVKISTSKSLEEWVSNLDGTAYQPIFSKLRDSGDKDSFDYEMALDLHYFCQAWNLIKRKLPAVERDNILRTFGVQLDLLNLQWIYRTKRYYSLTADTVRSVLIPLNYKLKKGQLERLIRTESADDFFAELSKTRYGGLRNDTRLSEKPDLEILSRSVLNHAYRTISKRHPYSMAVLNSYLYFKEEEIHKIITVIECIRYRVDTSEIIAYIEKH